jgi:Pectate lyase superfamily protein
MMKRVSTLLIWLVCVACGWAQNTYSERGDGIGARTGFMALSAADSERIERVAGFARAAELAQSTQGLPSGVAAANVDDFGADPTGTVDSSPAIQAAMDSGIAHIVFTSSGTYKVNAPVVIAPLKAIANTNMNDARIGRHVDGGGARIVAAGGIGNAFKIVTAAWPNNQRHLWFHGFRFDGSVTGAFVKFDTGASWHNHFSDLWTVAGAACTALLQFHNVDPRANPGDFSVRGVNSGCKYTIEFSVASGGLRDFDDFVIEEVSNGSIDPNSAALFVGNNGALIYSEIRNVQKGGDGHGIYAGGNAMIAKSRIARMYLEPHAGNSHYAVAGNLYSCVLENLWAYIKSHTAPWPAGMTDVRIVYGIVRDSTIRNVGIHSTAAAGPPYAVTYYPAIQIQGGGDVTVDFARRYIQNGIAMGAASSVAPVYWVNTPISLHINSTTSLQAWMVSDSIIDNVNQAVAATVTLPTAADGYRVRFVMATPGFAYHIKPAVGNRVFLDGTALADGNRVSNPKPAVGDAVSCYTFRSGVSSHAWICRGESGTWVNGGQ